MARVTVVGGDMRLHVVAKLLAARGAEVYTYCAGQSSPPGCVEVERDTLAEVLRISDTVVLPIPISVDELRLNAPACPHVLELRDIFCALGKKTVCFGGLVHGDVKALAEACGAQLEDYFLREELVQKNAAITSEGAIQILMEESAQALCDSRVLILGFGRIGKFLAHHLRAFGADVSVEARKPEDLTQIECYGYRAVPLGELRSHLGGQDIIVNTVPHLILGRDELAEVTAGALLLDLASKPGGIDFERCKEMGLRAIWALSLPGRVAPQSAGKVIADTVENMLKERGKK